jgi:putative ATP-binding cassette transporter
MSEGFNKSSNAAPSSLKSKVSPQLRPQIIMMFRALLASPQRNKISVLGVALAVIIGATAYGQIRLNAWNQPFYDALSRKDLAGFFAQLIVFCFIAVGL